jgi:tetratricopeptide (TPR) repeat protein
MDDTARAMQQPNKRWKGRALLLLVFLIGLGGLLWLANADREPSWRGKSLSKWLLEAKNSDSGFFDHKDPKVLKCRDAVRSIGTNAIPTLLRILQAKDSKLKQAAMDLIERQNLIKVPIQSSDDRKGLATIGFYFLGDLATNAVPALIELSKNSPSPQSKSIAANTLIRLYPAKSVAVPYWVPPEERVQWYLYAAHVQAELGAASNAVIAYSEAIQLEPTNEIAHLELGDFRISLQDFSGALKDFERALEISPTNYAGIFGRGLCHLGLKDFQSSELDFTSALNVESNNVTAHKYRGLARANLRNFDGALADLSEAIEVQHYDPELYRSRAAVQAMLTEYELAMADAAKALELEPKDTATYILRARIKCALKDYQGTIADSEKALQLSPNDPGALIARATARMCLDEFSHSTADLETALRLNPNNASAILIRAVLRAKRGGEDEAALNDFERARELAPQAPETHGILGWFQYKTSQWAPSLANCRKALELGAIANVSTYRGCIWLIRAQSGEEAAAHHELQAYLNSLESTKTNE